MTSHCERRTRGRGGTEPRWCPRDVQRGACKEARRAERGQSRVVAEAAKWRQQAESGGGGSKQRVAAAARVDAAARVAAAAARVAAAEGGGRVHPSGRQVARSPPPLHDTESFFEWLRVSSQEACMSREHALIQRRGRRLDPF